jgi:hypothetical protein
LEKNGYTLLDTLILFEYIDIQSGNINISVWSNKYKLKFYCHDFKREDFKFKKAEYGFYSDLLIKLIITDNIEKLANEFSEEKMALGANYTYVSYIIIDNNSFKIKNYGFYPNSDAYQGKL